MSLIVAVHNEVDIVIAWDRQSRYSPVPGHVFAPPAEGVQKVMKINNHLAIMVTGSYNSDKRALLDDFRKQHAASSLDAAFEALIPLGSKMVLMPNERGLMIGLAGYSAGSPTYRFVLREYGDPDMSYVLDFPRNYYLSGETEPLKVAEDRIQAEGLDAPMSTGQIETRLRRIVGDCIEQYPDHVLGPVEVLTLTRAEGTNLLTDSAGPETGGDLAFSRIFVNVALTSTCPDCQQQRPVNRAATCPECGANLLSEDVQAVRGAVRNRRQALKGRLNRLADRMHSATDNPLEFATRGIPLSQSDYVKQTMTPAMATLQRRHDAIAGLLATGTWEPGAPGCLERFKELVQALDAELDFMLGLSKTMPPLELRGVHRELTRASMQLVRGHVAFSQILCVVDADEAARLTDMATISMDRAAKHHQRASALCELVTRSPSTDPFRADGSLDVASLVWSTVHRKSAYIEDAANLVRTAFAEMPGVPALPDHYAASLLPALAVGAGVVDPEILTQRVRQLHEVLDQADKSGTWIVQPTELVDRVLRGIDRFAEEMEQLGIDAKYDLPRSRVMRTLTEIYRNLIEAVLCDLGSVVLVAARAGRGDVNSTYESSVVDGIKAGEVVTELDRMGAPCGGAIHMLYRNASAHGAAKVTDTGVILTARQIEQGREVSRKPVPLSDAEFAEDMVALQEVLLALELTILPWMWSTSNQALAAAVAKAPLTKHQIDQTVALLGGLTGLFDVSLTIDGSAASITAGLHEDNTDRRGALILSLVPAVFGLSAAIQEVTFSVKGLHPVLFDRSEFLESIPLEAPHRLTMLALTTMKWLVKSESAWTARDEATYVAFLLTMVHFACYRLGLMGDPPPQVDQIDQAAEYLRLVLSRLDGVLPAERRSELTRRAVEIASALDTNLSALAPLRRRPTRSPTDENPFLQAAAATWEAMYEVQEQAKALRDSDPTVGTSTGG